MWQILLINVTHSKILLILGKLIFYSQITLRFEMVELLLYFAMCSTSQKMTSKRIILNNILYYKIHISW